MRAFISTITLLSLSLCALAWQPGPVRVVHADQFDEVLEQPLAIVEFACEDEPDHVTDFTMVAGLLEDTEDLNMTFFTLRKPKQKKFLKNSDKPEPQIQTPEKDIAMQYYVKTFPQYAVFRNGQKIAHESQLTSGKVAYDFIKTHVPKGQEINRILKVPAEALSEMTRKYKVSFVARVPESSPVLEYMKNMTIEFPTAGVYMWVPSTEGVNDVLVFRRGEQARGCTGTGPMGDIKEKDMRKFVMEEQAPIFAEVEYLESLGEDPIKSLIVVHAQKDWIESNRETFEMVAGSKRGQFRLAWSIVRKATHIVPSFGSSRHPCALAQVYNPETQRVKYYAWYQEDQPELSLYENFGRFARDSMAGNWPVHHRTDVIPKYNHQNVKKVVTASFDDFTINSDRDVMLEVWGPNCRMCRSVSRKMEDWAKQMTTVKHLVVGRINAALNDCPMKLCDWSPRNLPQILFFKAGSKTPIQVATVSTLEQLTQVAEENSSRPWRKIKASDNGADFDRLSTKNRKKKFRERIDL